MNVDNFIDPEDITIEDASGVKREFKISRLPYLGGGRELCTQFVPTGTPRVGDYEANEKLAALMFKHIAAVTPDGGHQVLSTPQFVQNFVPDFQTGIKLEAAMLEHNLGFSVAEKISGFLDQLTSIISQSSTQILTAFQEHSSKQTSQQSTNSEQSIQ